MFSEPEGPYGEIHPLDSLSLFKSEEVKLLEFVERFESEITDLTGKDTPRKTLGILLYLIRSHFQGRVVTRSSLIDSSEMSYGSATRAIDALIAQGNILPRPRTKSGKSFTLHPSEALLRRWSMFSRQFRDEFTYFFKMFPEDSPDDGYGAPTRDDRVVGPPGVLSSRLPLSGSLRLLMHTDPTFAAMNSVKRQLENIFGCPIRSRALSIDRLQAQIQENARLANSRFDIVACDLPWTGDLASQGMLLPLDDFIAGSGLKTSDFHADAMASTAYLGRQYGIPIVTSCEMLVYRTDILSQAGLSPPSHKDDFIDALRQVHNPARNISGVSWNAGRGTPLGHSFMMMLSAFGDTVVDLPVQSPGFNAEITESWEFVPKLESDAALETAEFMLELLDYSPKNILNMAWYDRVSTFARGEVVFAYSHSLLAPVHELNKECSSFGNTGYLPHPTGRDGSPISPMGGYSLAIPSNLDPARVDAAWQAIEMLTSAEVAKLFASYGNLAVSRLSVARDPALCKRAPIMNTINRFTDSEYVRMWPRPPVPGISDLIAILGDELFRMLSERGSPAATLRRAQHRAEQIVAGSQ